MSVLSSLRAEVAAASRLEARVDRDAEDVSEALERLEGELAALDKAVRNTQWRQVAREAALRLEASRLDPAPAPDADLALVRAAVRRRVSRPSPPPAPTRTVSAAEVLSALARGDLALANAEIEGDLDLTQAGAEAHESDCVRVYAPHALTLDRCVLRGALILARGPGEDEDKGAQPHVVALERALVCSKTWLLGGVRADGAWFHDLSLADSGCAGPVSLAGARVWGDADLRGARFAAAVSFAGARFEGKALMDRVWWGAPLTLQGARCRGELSLVESEGDAQADLRGLRCADLLSLTGAAWGRSSRS